MPDRHSTTRASVNVLSGRWTCHSLDRTCRDLSCPAASITIDTHTAPDSLPSLLYSNTDHVANRQYEIQKTYKMFPLSIYKQT